MKMNYAGLWPRLMAHNIDMLVLLPLYYILSFFISSNSLLFPICLILTMIYEIYFIGSNWHATPGKRAVKIQVVNEKGEGLSYAKSALRTLNKLFSVITLIIGYLFIMLHPKKRALHDLLPGTYVIFSLRN